ncbi:MAG: hypothetical protein IPJ03_14615 [Ignavibacteriales bacterium]|nr:hypothetical protein [Ignavibacteriales bacterium]
MEMKKLSHYAAPVLLAILFSHLIFFKRIYSSLVKMILPLVCYVYAVLRKRVVYQ